ncbi:hypothetical protein CMUS01_07180 [Colletotrichum musicola]|uniref:Uncharacterized protein n=1 Tax=Colletotrichum musicola TaxID=2175873 RepID=A0A8H6NFT8_9PEZI|nr:hypothetical protein CMUS01_07180 [Colletotrichum musicola]
MLIFCACWPDSCQICKCSFWRRSVNIEWPIKAASFDSPVDRTISTPTEAALCRLLQGISLRTYVGGLPPPSDLEGFLSLLYGRHMYMFRRDFKGTPMLHPQVEYPITCYFNTTTADRDEDDD